MFKFRLESLLNHRRHLEDICQKELAACRVTLAAERRQLEDIRRRHAGCLHDIDRIQKTAHTPADILPFYRYAGKIAADLQQQRSRVVNAKKQVATQHRQLMAAVKKRKALEKLRDRHQAAYLRHLRQTEQKTMNEVASQRHHMNR